MKDTRIALVMCNAPVGEIRRNLDAMAETVCAAADEGAQLICFPELNVTGYCNQKALAKVAQPVPGPVTDRLLTLAATADAVILAGMAEKVGHGSVYASHVVAGCDGSLGIYRKVHIAPPERDIFTAGDRIPLFDAKGIKFGIQLCYDAHFPDLSTRMAEKGAELIVIPHASPRGDARTKHLSWMRHLPARAYDNSVFIAACNQIGENCKGLTFPGNAVILDPSGHIIAKDLSEAETLLIADLHAADLTAVRNHPMRYFLPNRRPELFGGTSGARETVQ